MNCAAGYPVSSYASVCLSVRPSVCLFVHVLGLLLATVHLVGATSPLALSWGNPHCFFSVRKATTLLEVEGLEELAPIRQGPTSGAILCEP